ncbi:alkylation response protein AidB-like acyl-CoA dehydrogenase [Allocatelliglobosispora scoriae]|uniref:Alkylation response protein AidB-like acyl-CoA dehydrogenase n=1 Tax=Allocatelliglobosispora scoriae TaxID=643052 RepID=A0A841BM18_9ACTN|nr:acyl-CoA dehydrogenase family protein [Allocatelliglobosispora scoriae]MBB5868398.1 alkylation response protein AidB-like acyl-CoA dehydrogenase [Allocatelliglobosispora scoriae]
MTSSISTGPTREELVRRAANLVPLLRKHAGWAEQNRRLHDEVIEGIADAGILRMRTPIRYGGYESDMQTQKDVMAELGRGDGSAGWVATVWTIPGWMVGMFPDGVQDEIYATPDVRVCGTLSPSAVGTPAPGGMVLNGAWSFVTGALHSHWQEVLAMAPSPDGATAWPVMAMVPMSDLQIIDDWHTSGMEGSGSVTTVAKDLFVPQERIVPLADVLAAQPASPRNAELPMYRTPLVAVGNASGVGVVVGMARAAWETFFERLGDRKITYTSYERQADAPVTHIKVAQVAQKIDQAEFHADRLTRLVDAKAASGEPWTQLERTRSRADVGSVCELTQSAVDLLSMASGGSSIYRSHPIQRIARDVRAVNLHALNAPETNFELYGRILCGLEPNSLYV